MQTQQIIPNCFSSSSMMSLYSFFNFEIENSSLVSLSDSMALPRNVNNSVRVFYDDW